MGLNDFLGNAFGSLLNASKEVTMLVDEYKKMNYSDSELIDIFASSKSSTSKEFMASFLILKERGYDESYLKQFRC